jgi:hypothetical protein
VNGRVARERVNTGGEGKARKKMVRKRVPMSQREPGCKLQDADVASRWTCATRCESSERVVDQGVK